MTDKASGADRLRSYLVPLATVGTIAFNWLAAIGRVNGVSPSDISDKYATPVTPAGYAFSIWSLIYLGMIAFSIYQLLPANAARFRSIRSLYILTSALNCGWIYFWHHDQIAICLALIFSLAVSLFLINLNLRKTDGMGEYWFAKAPFGIYFGWVTAATLVNFAVLLVHWDISISASVWTWIAVGLIFFAAALGVIIRVRLLNYLYPLAIAWALTAIGVKQSGQTLIVAAAAFGTIACLIATLSFVVGLPSTDNPRAVNE
ncbi:MAG: tryptophan-rich sensory protein [bacterium]|nr:tryptophan-rich sensory protein [bacterium]